MDSETDEDRWAEAQSLLDRTPTASADRLLRRARRHRLLLVLGIAVAAAAASLLVVFVVVDGVPFGEPTRVPTWRAVVGYVLSGIGLVGMVVALVVQLRGTRAARAWRSPMYVLTRAQRKELLAQVRGRAPEVPERVPLARHLAGLLLVQRLAILPQVGMLVNFIGLWIAEPETWRLVLIAVLALVNVLAGALFRREAARVRRFLAENPAPDDSVA